MDTVKAARYGVKVETITRNLNMAMGGYWLGDIKHGGELEPAYLVMQLPFTARAELSRLASLSIPSDTGGTVPLTLIMVPLGCITAGQAFCRREAEPGELCELPQATST